MSDLIIRYDPSTGDVADFEYPAFPDEYEPDHNELTVDSRQIDHRELHRKKVDTSRRSPQLIDDPEYRPSEKVDRAKISTETRETFSSAESTRTTKRQAQADAKEVGDMQAQIDALQAQVDAHQKMIAQMWTVLTGSNDGGRT